MTEANQHLAIAPAIQRTLSHKARLPSREERWIVFIVPLHKFS